MTYLIGLLLLALVGCAVTVYRLSGEIRYLERVMDDLDVNNHYLRERNRNLNAELLTRDVVTTTHGTATPAKLTIPSNHPLKRKTIRGKRK